MRISDWSSDVCSSDLPRFLSGDVETGLIAATLESLVPEPSPKEGMWKLAALNLGWMFDEANSLLADTPWGDLGGFRLYAARRAPFAIATNGKPRVIDFLAGKDRGGVGRSIGNAFNANGNE